MALTLPRNTLRRGNEDPVPVPVKGSTKCIQGGLAVLDGGYAAPGTAATGKLSIGKFKTTVDNTAGADGALTVEVEPGTFRWVNSAGADEIAQAQVGALCYIVDDQTVAKTDGGGTRSIAGTIAGVDSAGVWVRSHLSPAVDGTSLTAEIALREAITTDLAATTNGDGASLIGIEDAGSLITATTVEGALAEKLDGRRVANVANANLIGGVPVVHTIDVADGVTGDVDTVLTHKTQVLDVTVIKMAGAGGADDTITVKNVATAITNAIDINIADKVVARAGTVDDASNVVAAGAILRITRTKVAAANVACRVVLTCVRMA
jgi:hypothetical protein